MASTQARPIVEGGLLAAVSVAIALVSIYVPYANLIWPLPIALLGARHGVRWGVMSAVVGAMAVGLMVHVTQGLFFFLGSGLVGAVLGACMRRQVSAGRTIAFASAAALVSNLVLIGVGMLIMQVDLAGLHAQMQESVTLAVAEVGALMAADEAQRAQIEMLGQEMAQMITVMIPSVLAFCALITAVLNFVLTRAVMLRMRMEVPSFSPFESWRMPGWVLYLFVLSLVGIYWSDRWASDMLFMVSVNVNNVMALALFLHGLALLRYIANRNAFVRRVWWILVVLAFVLQMVNIMMIVLGGLDILMDYRKKHEKRV